MTTIFLSYARGDDEPFVRRLHADLTAAGFDTWFDRDNLRSRGRSFHQEIKDAIRQRDRLIYIAGPEAARSAYVQEEWQFALECDKTVIPILRLGDMNLLPAGLSALQCDDFRDDTQYPTQLAKLLTNLSHPPPPIGHLYGVPSLPAHFLSRPDILRRLKDALLVDLQRPVVITSATSRVGLQGMGGIGKSVLAAAVAHDREIRRSYPDGVVWVSFGQIATDEAPSVIAQLMRDVARHLGHQELFTNVAQGRGVLRELLLNKAVLLVLDDVWRASDAEPFDVLGPRCRALITTRDAGILHTLHGERYSVELFTEREALELLANTVESTPKQLPIQAREVVRECDGLALALALSASMARKRGGDWSHVLERLRRADLDRIADRESINEQHRSIYRAIQASVDALEPDAQRRFAELSVFATDRDVPEAAIARLWAHTGPLDDLDTADLLIDFEERSLIRLERKSTAAGPQETRSMSLHDLLYDYARRAAGSSQALSRTLLDAYRRTCPNGWHDGPDDGYFFKNLCQHLATATGGWEESRDLLCDLRFVAARCRVREVFALIADFHLVLDNLPDAEPTRIVRLAQQKRAAQWTAVLIEYAKAWTDRRGRVERGEPTDPVEPELSPIPAACRMWTDEEIVLESRRIVEEPSPFDVVTSFSSFVQAESYPLARFGSREGFVAQHAWNASPGGPVQIAATHPRLPPAPAIRRRWPVNPHVIVPPALALTLEGHSDAVMTVAITPDGRRAVSASDDRTLRVWDLETGVPLRTFSGHSAGVRSLTVTPDGRRAVSASWDDKVWVWDLETTAAPSTFAGGDRVTSLAVTPDGTRAVSASPDGPLCVWDSEAGATVATVQALPDSTVGIRSVSLLPDGRRAVSAGWDGELRVWDLETGAALSTLGGHTREASSVAVTPDGRRAVSAGGDLSLRVWDLERGTTLLTLDGHTERVWSVAITPDGRRAVSAGEDRTVRLWDLETGGALRVLTGHVSAVLSVALTADGRRAISAGWDESLKVWDLETGATLRTPEHHADVVTNLVATPDGRGAVSASADCTLRVWDLETGAARQRLEGHTKGVLSVAVTPDGRRAVSGSEDQALRVWDLETGRTLRTLEGHAGSVDYLVITPDGQEAVSASTADGTLRVWDLETGAARRTFGGPAASTSSIVVTPNGRCALSADYDRLQVWNVGTGAVLTLDERCSAVSCVAVTPDGRRAVSAGRDGSLHVWDLETGARLFALVDLTDWVSRVAIAPDGRCAVSVSLEDHTLHVWDLEKGVLKWTLDGHAERVTSLEFTSDGRRAVTASDDRTLRVWDLDNGACAALLAVPISCVAIVGSGERFCVGTRTGEIHVYDLLGG